MEIIKNKALNNLNSWRIGGRADFFCQPESSDELKEVLQWAKQKKMKSTVLGSGTNVLISDQGVEGLVISTSKLQRLTFKEEAGRLWIRAEAGVLKQKLMRIFKKFKLAPALFLAGLPGDLGGGIVMNAGSGRGFSPSEFSEIVRSFRVMSAEGLTEYKKESIDWHYRQSKGWKKGVLFSALLSWPLEEMAQLNERMREELKRRQKTQPLTQASCGSVFKNYKPHFAGDLIERAGLKGLKLGSAKVSEKHANFIVNEGGAKAMDVYRLMQKIQQRVYEKFGLELKPEVRLIGRWPKSFSSLDKKRQKG